MFDIIIKTTEATDNAYNVITLKDGTKVTMVISTDGTYPLTSTIIDAYLGSFALAFDPVGAEVFMERDFTGTLQSTSETHWKMYCLDYRDAPTYSGNIFKSKVRLNGANKPVAMAVTFTRAFMAGMSARDILDDINCIEDVTELTKRIAFELPFIMMEDKMTCVEFKCHHASVSFTEGTKSLNKGYRYRLGVRLGDYFGDRHTVIVKCDLKGQTSVELHLDVPVVFCELPTMVDTETHYATSPE